MRIGAWNLEGRWSSDHLALLGGQECDVWFLTDMPSEASIPDNGLRFATSYGGAT